MIGIDHRKAVFAAAGGFPFVERDYSVVIGVHRVEPATATAAAMMLPALALGGRGRGGLVGALRLGGGGGQRQRGHGKQAFHCWYLP